MSYLLVILNQEKKVTSISGKPFWNTRQYISMDVMSISLGNS